MYSQVFTFVISGFKKKDPIDFDLDQIGTTYANIISFINFQKLLPTELIIWESLKS